MKRNVLLVAAGPALVTSLLLLALGAGAGWYVDNLQSEVTGLADRNIRATRHSEELLLALRDVRVRLLRYLHSSDTRFLQIPLEQNKAERLLDNLTDRLTRKESKSLIGDLKTQTDQLFDELADVLSQPGSKRGQP